MTRYVSRVLILCGVLMLSTFAVINAQDDPAPIPVTDDEVNEVASQMYCPICEMEPLDTCGASTCVLWREQIREELEAGRTRDEIIDSFIERYGERVVGIPEDPALRGFSLFAPIAIAILGLLVGGFTFMRWNNKQKKPLPVSAVQTDVQIDDSESDDDPYLSQLESDLRS